MSALSIEVPFPVFQDRDGQPLENGYVWLGVANLNPQTNPVIAYFDKALTIPAAQPLRTINGYISNAGTPAQVYVDGVSFSILVQDSKGSMVYNFPDGTGISPDACGVTYDPPFAGGVAYPVCEKLEQTVSVKDFGAVGDGVADDTNAFLNAIATNKSVFVPIGNYRLTSVITLTQVGQVLEGENRATTLIIDQTTGPGIYIKTRQCTLKNLVITASNTRQSYTNSGIYDLAAGLFGVQIYNTSGSTTQCLISGVTVQRQPSHGFYAGASGTGTIYQQCFSLSNRGHGYMFDDRSELGGTPARGGIVDLVSCIAIDNGGNAVNLSQDGFTCYRFRLTNLETFNNAWNTSITALENSEVFIKGENHYIETSAVSDQNGDTKTVTATGDTRLPKTTLSRGIFVGSFSNNINITNMRFISVSTGVRTGTELISLYIESAYFTQQQLSAGPINVSVGFIIGNDCENLSFNVAQSSAVTTLITSNTLNSYPLVVDKNLAVTFNIPSTSTFHAVLTESVYLPAGFYRVNISATVLNGATDTQYSLRFVSGSTIIDRGNYSYITASSYLTIPLSFIYKNTISETKTLTMQIRQQSGALGSILPTNNTFGNTMMQVERIA